MDILTSTNSEGTNTSVTPAILDQLNAPSTRTSGENLDALGQADFLRLLTVQLEQQDPLEPVDNTDMLAQLAQFSALAGNTTTNSTLEEISTKLDALIAVQTPA
jgi:flagellar basal-body rod modification protein FlgD